MVAMNIYQEVAPMVYGRHGIIQEVQPIQKGSFQIVQDVGLYAVIDKMFIVGEIEQQPTVEFIKRVRN